MIRRAIYLTGIITFMLFGGCNSYVVTPTAGGYDFMKEQRATAILAKNPNRPDLTGVKLSAHIVSPAEEKLIFEGNGPIIVKQAEKPYQFVAGIYPFKLENASGQSLGSGAMAVYDIDKTVALATFGLSPETRMFNDEVVQKARNGTLSSQVISFDGKPRITYWLGNRITPATVDKPTAELDFRDNPGLVKVIVRGTEARDKIATVETEMVVPDVTRVPGAQAISNPFLYSLATTKPGDPTAGWISQEHEFVLSYGPGKTYRGYVKNVRNCDYTMFMRLPCKIPADLLTAASSGTISKLTIYADNAVVFDPLNTHGDDETPRVPPTSAPTTQAGVPLASPMHKIPVAELVFGATGDSDAR